MPFHPAPAMPQGSSVTLPFRRGSYELERGPLAGREIHFIDEGPRAATPILMLHGNPTWSFIWRQVISGLPQFRCVAPDLLGFGFSSRLPRICDHSLERHADAIAELVRALDLRDVVLCGHDWGGPIVTALGARMPANVRAVVLANTAVIIPKHPRSTLFHRFARMPYLSDIVFRGLGFPQNMLWTVQADRRSIAGDIAHAYRFPLRRLKDRVGPLALARMVPDSCSHPSVDELRRGQSWLTNFSGAIRLVWGQNDPLLGRALERHRRELPNARVWTTNAGHFLQEEVPEVFSAVLKDAATQPGPSANASSADETQDRSVL